MTPRLESLGYVVKGRALDLRFRAPLSVDEEGLRRTVGGVDCVGSCRRWGARTGLKLRPYIGPSLAWRFERGVGLRAVFSRLGGVLRSDIHLLSCLINE